MSERRLFLSYRREDSAGHAGRLADHLLDRYGAASLFMDVGSIEAGADFTAEIERAISDSESVLVVIRPGWLDAQNFLGTRRLDDPADFVRREVETALALRGPRHPRARRRCLDARCSRPFGLDRRPFSSQRR